MHIYRENLGKQISTRRLLIGLAIVAALIWIWALWPRQPLLTVTFLDVRQGDSAVIQTPGGKTILVDAGSGGNGSNRYDVGMRTVTPFLRSKGIRKLDLLVMTHPHEDHIGGMPGVLKATGARGVLDSGAENDSAAYRRTLKLVKDRRIKYVRARRGQRISFEDGVALDVLNPDTTRNATGSGEDESEINNQSVVLRVTYKRSSFLFTGDAEQEAEEHMIARCGRLRSTVLKVAHHGSSSATSALWLKAVRPRIAVISVGRFNQFGHPDPETLQRLADSGTQVLRTDEDGAVTVITDGERMSVSTTRH